MSKFEVVDKWVDGISLWINELQLRKVSPRKKRPALWIETAGRHIILRGRKGFKMYTPDGYYTNTSHCNQQARRLAKQLGIEVRK